MCVCLLCLAENVYNKCKIRYYSLNCVTACVHHVRQRVQPDDIRRSNFHRRCRTPDCGFSFDYCTPTTCEESRCHISFRLERGDSLRSLMLPCQTFTAAALGRGTMKWLCLQINCICCFLSKKDGLHFEEQKELHFSHKTKRYMLEFQHSRVLISHNSHKATVVYPPLHITICSVLSIWNSAAVCVIALQSLLLLNYKLED